MASVIDGLSDAELEALLWAAADRLAWYLAPSEVIVDPSTAARQALARALELALVR